MSDANADTIVILSTELIEKITQEYFNRTMFKQRVEIVESKPHGEAGYAFSVRFAVSQKKAETQEEFHAAIAKAAVRSSNGRFTKHG